MNNCKKGGFLTTLFNAILGYILPKPSFFILSQDEYGGDEVFGYKLIKRKADLPQIAIDLELDFDFSEAYLVLLSLGSKPTGGYGITVTDTERCGCTLVLQYKTTKPQKGQPVTTAFTNPYCLIAIPKYNKIKLVN